MQTFWTVLPYVGCGVAGIVVWYVVTKGLPAGGSAVKNWWTAETKSIEARLTAVESKLGLVSTPTVATAPVTHTGPVGATGAH